jgi:Fe-S-cluster-containing hydrogenase component 2
MVATIDAAACDRSPACPARRVCPRGAVQRLADGPFVGSYGVNADLCTACGVCVSACPARAVSMIDSKE